MKRTLILAGILCIALVPGCGQESNRESAEKPMDHEADEVESVGISEAPAGEVPEEGVKTDAYRQVARPDQERTASKRGATPVVVGDANFETEVLKSDVPVVVDFWAPWCKPCLIAAPVLERMAAEYAGRLKVCKLDVDKGRQTAMRYRIRSIPTVNFYKNGKVVDQIIGVTPNYEQELRKKIESHL